MNYIKVQKEILDNFLKKSVLYCQTVDDFYLISDNGFQIFKIPMNDMWLDIKKMMGTRTEQKFLSNFFKIEGENGLLTDEIKELSNQKKTLVIKVSSQNNSAWIDKKLIERFGIKNGLHFTISGAKQPLLVWENDEIRGCILPVNVKG